MEFLKLFSKNLICSFLFLFKLGSIALAIYGPIGIGIYISAHDQPVLGFLVAFLIWVVELAFVVTIIKSTIGKDE